MFDLNSKDIRDVFLLTAIFGIFNVTFIYVAQNFMFPSPLWNEPTHRMFVGMENRTMNMAFIVWFLMAISFYKLIVKGTGLKFSTVTTDAPLLGAAMYGIFGVSLYSIIPSITNAKIWHFDIVLTCVLFGAIMFSTVALFYLMIDEGMNLWDYIYGGIMGLF